MKYIKSDFYREVSPPDSLSSMSTGTPSGKSDNSEGSSGEGSQLPNGDTSRNIGRPSPDSPSLKSRNLDRSESYGRTPAEKPDFGYVHDSGSGSARVIPYDSGFTNNSSALRKASARRVVQRWKESGLIQPSRKDFEVLEDATKYLYAFNSKTGLSLIRDKEDIPLTKDYPKILVSDLPQKLISEILSGFFNNPSPKYRFPKEVTSWLNWAKEEGVFEVEDSIHTQIEKHCNYLSSLIEWTKKQYLYFKPQTHKSLEYLEIDLDDIIKYNTSIGTILKTIKKIEHFFYACTRYVNKNKEVALRPTPVPKMKWEVTRDAKSGLGVLVPHALLEGFKKDVFLHPLDPLDPLAERATATHRKFKWGHLIEINLLRPFSTVQKSLHHEIIHGVQSEMQDELGIEGAGKPTSKNQSTGHLQNQGGEHSLDDIEFYTKTNDSIADWGLQVVNRARTISDLNKRIRSEFKWDLFLRDLKRYGESPEGDDGLRWRKATKLIVQTLQNAFKRKQKGEVFNSHLDFVGFKTSKKAGLIKPPKHLVDKASEILRAGFASYWVEKQREMDEKPVSPLSLEHISNFEDLMGNLEDVYMSLRVGEATFDELDTALRDLKTKTQDLIGMGVPLMGGLHEHLGEMSPISVFEEPEEYEGDFDYIFSKKNRVLKRLKTTLDRNREASRPYISETSRRLYERESDKVKRFDGLSHERYLRTWDLQTEELGTIRLMVRKSDVKGTKGFYRYEDNLHKIAVLTDPKSTDLSDKELDNIKGYVRHELVHVMQKQMSLSFNVDQAGIPFQKYDETYRQRQMGARKEKDLKDQYARAGLDPRLIQIHALDDIEFYTRLLDEVVAFQNLNRNRSDLNQEAHDWVSKRIFFASLKRFKIKSWKKAVGIFVDAVQLKAKSKKYKKKASASRVAYRYLQSASQPAQDLGGVKTWVDKNRQDQVQNDTSSPDKSREDYEDGKPQRDRVLPLPSGHPEGRDEQRVGPGQINSPPDSSGQGGANRPKKDPAALSDHPNGKALHERPRSSGVPGDEYGNPYIDQSQSTGLTRRVMASIDKISYVKEEEFYSEEEDFYWDVEDGDIVKNALFRYNFRPPRGDKRQRQQKGQAKRKSLKNKRKNRVKYRRNLVKQKRLYKRRKHNPTYKKYKKNYAKNPQRYKRRPGGGVSTSKQKSQRAEKRSK